MGAKQTLRRITGNDYLFTIATKVLALAIGVIASAYSARYLGPALKGQLSVISSVLTIVAVVANFGLYQPYPYYKRQGEPNVRDRFLRIFAAQFLIYTVLGIVLTLIFRTPVMMAVCLIAPIQVLANQMSFMLMVEDVKYKNVIFFTARLTNTVITVLAFYTLRPSLLVALACIVVGDLITVIMGLCRLRTVPNPFKAEPKFAAKILPFGIVAMLTTLLLTLNYRIDVLMLNAFQVTDAEIGFYSLGVSLSEYLWIIPDAFREVLFSRTAKDDSIGDITMSMKMNLYIMMVLILCVVLLGKPLIALVYGADFLPAYGVTCILIFGVVSMSYFKIIGTLLLAQGKKMVYLGMLTVSVIVNMIANCFFIPWLGKSGAALASVLSYTVAGLVFLIYFMKTYHVPFKDVFVLTPSEVKGMVRKLRK